MNNPPPSYKQTESSIEQYLIEKVANIVIRSDKIHYSFCQDEHEDETKNEFVLRLPRFGRFVLMLLYPDSLVGEYYCRGLWYLHRGDVSELIRHLYTQGFKQWYIRYYIFLSKNRWVFHYLKKFIFRFHYKGSIAKHYDIDSELYELFLDEEMLYTCAFFDSEEESLSSAQDRKLDVITKRLDIEDGQCSVLDIGSGWGGMERHIAKQYKNAHVVGLSLSNNQIDWAKKKNNIKLTKDQNNRVTYRLESIYEHSGVLYNRIVAIGMIEHVGKDSYIKFFKKIKSLLQRDGKVVIHTIICPYNNFPANRWIEKNIFPGGYAPSISEVTSAIEDSGLLIKGIYLYDGRHYRRTIDLWRNNFIANWHNNSNHIYDKFSSPAQKDKFFRLWYFYLSSVRNMFFDDTWKYKVAHFVLKKS